ncbi:hypothetical protein V6N13_043495 [Hibiscus sabdariffa]
MEYQARCGVLPSPDIESTTDKGKCLVSFISTWYDVVGVSLPTKAPKSRSRDEEVGSPIMVEEVRRSETEGPTRSKCAVKEVGGNELETSMGLGPIPDKVNEPEVSTRSRHVVNEVGGTT